MFLLSKLDDKAYIHWDKLPEGFKRYPRSLRSSWSGLSQTPEKSYNFPTKLGFIDSWFDGIASYFCLYVVVEEKKYLQSLSSSLFVIGVLAHVAGLM